MYENTEFTLSRDCEAIQIPSGQKTTIPAGTQGVVTQSLGGSYTIATYQGLARVAEKDLDALGLQKPQAEEPAKTVPTDGAVSEEDVWNQLRQCYDPEIPVNIADLGLIYKCEVSPHPEGDYKVDIDMSLTAPGCGMGDVLKMEVESKLERLPGVKACEVELVFDPPWDMSMMPEATKLQLGML